MNAVCRSVRRSLANLLIRSLSPAAASLVARFSPPRGLTPYPAWRFDIDLDIPDTSLRRRRRLWEALQSLETPGYVTARWHHGTRLRLDMRNDIARQVFVGRTIDPNEFAFLSRVIKPGMVVADIGANEGLYTVFCASLVQPEGAVLAFEPSPRERARLKENVHLNSLSNIEVLPLALADFCGEVCLHIADDLHAGHNTLGRFIYDVPLASVETVEAVTLDSLFETRGWTRLDIVKADIEGAELRFLRGAERTLRRCCPLILMEASAQALEAQDCTVEQLFGFLHRLSYEIYSFSADTGLPVPAARPPSRENHNFVAIPDSAARNARTLLYNLDWAQ